MVLGLGYYIFLICFTLPHFSKESNIITHQNKSEEHFPYWKNPPNGINYVSQCDKTLLICEKNPAKGASTQDTFIARHMVLLLISKKFGVTQKLLTNGRF